MCKLFRCWSQTFLSCIQTCVAVVFLVFNYNNTKDHLKTLQEGTDVLLSLLAKHAALLKA